MQRVKDALDSTGYAFAHFGWSKQPSGDYGVYAEDGARDFEANGRHEEKGLTGTIDYFTRDDSGTPKTVIENAINGLFPWYLNSIQYENDTGFIHYEWVFSLYG